MTIPEALTMPEITDQQSEADLITRREAIRRVTLLLGGLTLVGGDALLTGCGREGSSLGRTSQFTAGDVAFLDEVADTILPATSTPGAKAAKTGEFMARMVTDSYAPRDQQVFRDGMRTLDDDSRVANGVPFVEATPAQRLALLKKYDAEQRQQTEARDTRQRAKAIARLDEPLAARAPEETKTGDAFVPDERKENVPGAPQGNTAAPAITAEPPAHFFRMMKELALLGYFTSEIGCTQAQRYMESPGKFEPCIPYVKGTPAWAGHA
jgi:hypothetical protein